MGSFSLREKDRMRAAVMLLALTPALSRREREKSHTYSGERIRKYRPLFHKLLKKERA